MGKVNLLRRKTVVDYGNLVGACRNASVPSDIDGVLERNGHFLFLECKHPEDAELSDGQKLMYERLARQSRRNKVIVVMLSGQRTEVGALEFVPLRFMNISKGTGWIDTNLDDFRERIQSWEREALKSTF